MKTQTPHELANEIAKYGWSEQRIADAVNTTQPTIHRISKDPNSNPSWHIYSGLQKVLASLQSESESSDQEGAA